MQYTRKDIYIYCSIVGKELESNIDIIMYLVLCFLSHVISIYRLVKLEYSVVVHQLWQEVLKKPVLNWISMTDQHLVIILKTSNTLT